jgi:hypothetical protein
MNRARTYHCTMMRHCIEQSNGLVPPLLCPSWVDCTEFNLDSHIVVVTEKKFLLPCNSSSVRLGIG